MCHTGISPVIRSSAKNHNIRLNVLGFESHCNLKTYAHPVAKLKYCALNYNINHTHPVTTSIIRTQLQIHILHYTHSITKPENRFTSHVQVECGLYRGTCEEYVSVEESVCLSACLSACLSRAVCLVVYASAHNRH